MLGVRESPIRDANIQTEANSDVLTSTMKLRAELAQLSYAKLDEVEDELNFYAFTRIQSAQIQKFLI